MNSKLWTSDFQVEPGAIFIKKTGHRIPMDLRLVQDIWNWLQFYARMELNRLAASFSRSKRKTIAFLPRKPRPWYLIWAVAAAGGLRIVSSVEDADLVMQFDDSTTTDAIEPPAGRRGRSQRRVNFDCLDVSKTAVANAFERAAGYTLAVNPQAWAADMVEKSEINAAHDGRVVRGPIKPVRGQVYQRLVDNQTGFGMVEDLRTLTFFGEILLVFRKRRPLAYRFANENATVDVLRPRDVYSIQEIALIRRFTEELRLDWGGIDVLRDRKDGRIYIVDANKTDMGPPLALPLSQQVEAVHMIARRLAGRLADEKTAPGAD